jgi:SAM-dependent methyltransferase
LNAGYSHAVLAPEWGYDSNSECSPEQCHIVEGAVVNKAIVSRLKQIGVAGLFGSVVRRAVARPIVSFGSCRDFFAGAIGLEIGGPSALFGRRGLFPVYALADRIDNCNFSAQTIWERPLQAGATFRFDKNRPCGNQFFFEATDLSGIAPHSYDFVLSSHALEHVANPLRALVEWIRSIKSDGILTLVVPHKEGTFDHRRPTTTLEHLISDFERETPESDTTHVAEILQMHDLSRDPEAGDFAAFSARAKKNLENRGLHHHVFDTPLAASLISYLGLQILAVEAVRPYHIFVVARKPREGEKPNNDLFMGCHALYRRLSPFAADKNL